MIVFNIEILPFGTLQFTAISRAGGYGLNMLSSNIPNAQIGYLPG